MDRLNITIGDDTFVGFLELGRAPATCAAFVARLPFETNIIHVRWSGEAVWMPLGELDFEVGFENATSYPAPGQIILYPGGISETEILMAYGPCRFASKAGQLAGNPLLAIRDGLDRLADIGRQTLQNGAMPIRFTGH
jgi:hypothetical protein